MPSDLPSSVSLFHLLRADFGTSLSLLHCTKATLVHLSHTLEDLVLRQRIPSGVVSGTVVSAVRCGLVRPGPHAAC